MSGVWAYLLGVGVAKAPAGVGGRGKSSGAVGKTSESHLPVVEESTEGWQGSKEKRKEKILEEFLRFDDFGVVGG
jgi:hypothetical protein